MTVSYPEDIHEKVTWKKVSLKHTREGGMKKIYPKDTHEIITQIKGLLKTHMRRWH